VGDGQHLTVYILFDTGADPYSFVSRKIAAWIMARQSRRPTREDGSKERGTEGGLTLAGTAQTTLIYGSVDFDLTFLNEVTRRHETIFAINAKIIDSCIDIIVSRPVIRAYHLIHKIPYYFDEVTRSKPDLSHSILPATPARAIVNCINAIPCAQCPTFYVPGYDINLCALVSEETDHLLVLSATPSGSVC
jgi:hypothetical protein